ncbi:MAG: hypothetical protein OXU20_38550 [Myxococcales bacterium]|nr:hypothetical protein [Myxococcales bacterium]
MNRLSPLTPIRTVDPPRIGPATDSPVEVQGRVDVCIWAFDRNDERSSAYCENQPSGEQHYSTLEHFPWQRPPLVAYYPSCWRPLATTGSSLHPPAGPFSPAPGRPGPMVSGAHAMGQRVHYLDQIRTLAMLAGVLFHAAISYRADGGREWLLVDPNPLIGFAVVVLFIHLFRMAPHPDSVVEPAGI